MNIPYIKTVDQLENEMKNNFDNNFGCCLQAYVTNEILVCMNNRNYEFEKIGTKGEYTLVLINE